MGLFSSKSKSTATTTYTDSSTNQNFGTGDFLASDKNNVAGGDIYNQGLSEDMVSNIFSGVNEQTKTLLGNVDKLYSGALTWVEKAIGTQSENLSQQTAALASAYNSEQATYSSFKTYALYALIGFIAWAYISKTR